MNNPQKTKIAILISDVHYNVHTLELADKAMRLAINKANELGVKLIVAGDLHDTKANLRGECVNAMIDTFKTVETKCYISVGNHDLINEKSKENSIEFLSGLNNKVQLVRDYLRPVNDAGVSNCKIFAYHSDINLLKNRIKNTEKSSIFILHQGLTGSNMGDYIQDKSAITDQDVAGLRVISGHYHTKQTIALPGNGTWDYIGNPYSLSWGEANDYEKGFQILYSDGSLDFVPTNLRKHVIIKADLNTGENQWSSTPIYVGNGRNDLVWVKFTGNREKFNGFNKEAWLKEFGIPGNSKVTYEYTDDIRQISAKQDMSQTEILDSTITNNTSTLEECQRLQKLWKSL